MTRSGACKSTLLTAFLVSLFGCQGLDITAEPDQAPGVKDKNSVAAPKSLAPTDLALIRDTGRVLVGDYWNSALQVFPEPKGSFEVDDTPAGFLRPYGSKEWERAKEGFGTILYGDKIAVAMYSLDGADVDRLDSTVQRYTNAFPNIKPSMFFGARVKYWFWHQANQTLMISGLLTDRDGVRMTIALGDDMPLAAIGVTETRAQDDLPKVESLLSRSARPKPR